MFKNRFIRVSPNEDYIFREFCDKIINADGTILLRMVSLHANELFTQDVLKILWDNYWFTFKNLHYIKFEDFYLRFL